VTVGAVGKERIETKKGTEYGGSEPWKTKTQNCSASSVGGWLPLVLLLLLPLALVLVCVGTGSAQLDAMIASGPASAAR